LIVSILYIGIASFAQENKVTITIRNVNGKSKAEMIKNLPLLAAGKDVKDWMLIVDNQLSTNLHLKFQDYNNKIVVLTKNKKSTFPVKNNKFPVAPGDSLELISDPIPLIMNQDGDTISKEPIQINVTKKINLKPNPTAKAPSTYKIGILYYDAAYLASPEGDPTIKNEILTYYKYSQYSASLSASLKITADKIFRQINLANAQNALESQQTSGISLLNSIGNYDVTNIADGIARFLVKRVKEELSIAFFQHFKDVLDKPPTSDLRYLFPTTYDVLHSIDNEIYNWDNYITMLRDAFDKDISNLVPDLETFEANATMLSTFRDNTACHASARVAMYVAKGFIDHIHAGQLLDDFDADEYIRPTEKDASDKAICQVTFNLRNAVKSLQLISASLRSGDEKEFWITDSELKELLRNDDLSGCYNLLLWLEAMKQNIRFQKDAQEPSKVVYFSTFIDDWNKLQPVISGFVVKIKDFRSSYAKMMTAVKDAASDSAKAKISYIDLYPFIQSSINIIKYSDETLLRLKVDSEIPGLKEVLVSTGKVLDLLTKGGELGMDLSLKRYSAVIADLTYLMNRTALMAVASPGMAKSSTVNADTLKTFTESLIKYGTFIASVANAKSSEEVQKVVENHALPTGSSRIKRESAFNVSLNAYPGLYAGYEQIMGVDPGWTISSIKINSYGIIAPIGIAISIGHRKLFKANWSYSLFISAIDIGAITSFRFKNDSVASVPTIKLKDILSPGLFLSIGIPGCPLSVNIGAQIGPNLRVVNEPTQKNPDLQNTYSDSMYLRYSISLCMDIPILTLANKLDRKK